MTAPDLRLLPAAGALWAGSAIGLHTGLTPAGAAVGALAVVALVAARRAAAWAIWWVAMLLGLLLAALRVDAAAPASLHSFLDGAGMVRVEAVIDAEPRVQSRPAFGGLEVEPMLSARATVVRVEADGAAWRTSVPVVLTWSPAAGPLPQPGQSVAGLALFEQGSRAARNAYWVRLHGAPEVVQRESRAAHLATTIRRGLARATGAGDGGDGAALLPGLVLGDTAAQSPQLVEDLRVAGLSHLTSVSGANLAIVVAAVAWALSRTGWRRLWRHLLTLASIGAFVAVVQPQPSVVRAAVMAGISVFAVMSGTRRTGAAVLWLATIALLVIDPFLAWQWGFALSVAATAGLILLAPQLVRWAPGVLGRLVAITLSAQIATFPLLLAMGQPPTWLSIPANVLCEPLVAPATVIGFLATLIAALAMLPGLGIVLAPAATIVALPGVAIAEVIARVARWGAATPLAVAPVSSMGVLLLVTAGCVVAYRWGLRRRTFALALLLWLVVSVCMPDGPHRWPQADWRYAMCDVGQGDATVVNLGDGEALVIDAGPAPHAVRMCLRRLGVRRVPGLFLTHFHADHVEGLPGVLAQAQVDRVFATPVREPAIEWTRSRALLAADPVTLVSGDRIRFGQVLVRVLWPDPRAVSGEPNNGSLVLDVAIAGRRLLLTGDIDPAAQSEIRLPVGGHAVIKVPHHASRYQDPGFVGRVAPLLALVSVGSGNSYGHPAPDTLAAYRRAGVRILRTDVSGPIAVSWRHGSDVLRALSG